MLQYVARRLLAMIPTLLGITFITFLMINLAPGDPVALSLGAGAGTGTTEGGSGGGGKSSVTQAVEAKKKLLGILEKDLSARLWSVPPDAPPDRGAPSAPLSLSDRTAALEGWPRALVAAPGGGLLAGTDAGEVFLLDAAGEVLRAFPRHPKSVTSLAIDGSGTFVASGDDDGGIRLSRAADGKPAAEVAPLGKTVRALAFANGGNSIVAATSDGVLRAIDTSTGKVVHERREHTGHLAALAASPDGRRLWSGGFDRKLREWDAGAMTPLRVLGSHGQAITALAVSADGSRLASASDDRLVRVFDLRAAEPATVELGGHVKEVTAVALSADGARAFSGSRDESIRAWDTVHGRETARSREACGAVSALVATPDGAHVWSASESWVKAPLWKRYGRWLGKLATFDFDRSLTDERKVSDKMLEALPVTIGINVLAILIIYLISIPLGVAAAVRRGSAFDSGSSVVLFLLYSMPSFWVATLLITRFSSVRAWNWFPCVGLHATDHESLTYLDWLGDFGMHLVLPMAVICYGGFSSLSRFVRTSMLETISQDYVRTARAKGLPERVVIYRHAFRNSLVTIVTLLATLLPGMIGGSVIIEQIFGIHGMGWLGFEAISERDYPVIMAVTTMSAVLTLVGVLLSDLLYSVVDPRIRHE